MKIEQYIPAFFEGFKKENIDVNSFEEIMNTEWIKRWSSDKDFYRYSINVDGSDYYGRPEHALMAELKNGTIWYVIATIREKNIDIITDNLPKWQPVSLT